MDLSNVRIREHFGLLSNDTHTGQFNFLVSPPKSRSGIEKHDYVLVDHPLFGEACQILATITDITSYEEVAGGSSAGDRLGKMLATAQIVGYIDLRNEAKPLCEVLVPPNPGSRVYVPLKTFLEDVLNRNAAGEVFKKPIQIGVFEASSAEETGINARVKWLLDSQDFTSKHTIITSVAGAGKTHTAKLLVKEIIEKNPIQIILFDPYNEYSKAPNAIQKNIALDVKTDKETLISELKKGQTTILTAQGLTLEEKQTFYTEIIKIILKLRFEGRIKPLFLVIEEGENLKGETLEDIVSQGRKTGVCLCLLTSHPIELGGKILSQMENQIIGKTIDTKDLETFANIAGTRSVLPGLALGEWIVNGVGYSRPMKVYVNA